MAAAGVLDPLGIYKRKRTVIFHLFYHFKRFLEIFFCLSRESDNNIGRQRNIRNCLPEVSLQSSDTVLYHNAGS